ncbi:MAG: hypothetical protein ACREGA_04015 [Candidatus Saccharimonadales bacterium]
MKRAEFSQPKNVTETKKPRSRRVVRAAFAASLTGAALAGCQQATNPAAEKSPTTTATPNKPSNPQPETPSSTSTTTPSTQTTETTSKSGKLGNIIGNIMPDTKAMKLNSAIAAHLCNIIPEFSAEQAFSAIDKPDTHTANDSINGCNNGNNGPSGYGATTWNLPNDVEFDVGVVDILKGNSSFYQRLKAGAADPYKANDKAKAKGINININLNKIASIQGQPAYTEITTFTGSSFVELSTLYVAINGDSSNTQALVTTVTQNAQPADKYYPAKQIIAEEVAMDKRILAQPDWQFGN